MHGRDCGNAKSCPTVALRKKFACETFESRGPKATRSRSGLEAEAKSAGLPASNNKYASSSSRFGVYLCSDCALERRASASLRLSTCANNSCRHPRRSNELVRSLNQQAGTEPPAGLGAQFSDKLIKRYSFAHGRGFSNERLFYDRHLIGPTESGRETLTAGIDVLVTSSHLVLFVRIGGCVRALSTGAHHSRAAPVNRPL